MLSIKKRVGVTLKRAKSIIILRNHHLFSHLMIMMFEEKYFSYCILLTDQISLSDGLYFVKYWAICEM